MTRAESLGREGVVIEDTSVSGCLLAEELDDPRARLGMKLASIGPRWIVGADAGPDW